MNKPTQKFVEGEKVLCFHGPLIYEAKCLKCRPSEKETFEYFVHYAGWNKKWDEWVPQKRVLKHNPRNVSRQKDLKAQKNFAPKKSKGSKIAVRGSKTKDGKPRDARSEGSVNDPDSRSSTPVSDSLSRKMSQIDKNRLPENLFMLGKIKLRQEVAVESEVQFLSRIEIKIKIPNLLQPWLVDDYLLIHKKRKLLVLPAKYTVDNILEMYVNTIKGRNTIFATIRPQLSGGLYEYFNTMLNPKLLFKAERHQYDEFTANHPGLQPSQICGAHHLLRLFVALGRPLTYTRLNERETMILLSALQDFLKFLAEHMAIFYRYENYA